MPCPALAEAGYKVGLAAADQTAAMLALLPELLSAAALPPRFVVAHAPDDSSQLLGAAAFVPLVHHADWPGFKSQCRVLPAFRRRGIGRALLLRLAHEARAWNVPHLHAWSAHQDRSVEAAFLKAVRFRPGTVMQHFILDTALMRSALLFVQQWRARGRIPAGALPLALDQGPIEPLVALFCAEFGGAPAQARAIINRTLADPMGRALSLALWHTGRDGQPGNGSLAGFLLAGAGHADGQPEVFFWACEPGARQGWPAALLLEQFTAAMEQGGHARARYHCNDRAMATLNLVRHAGALPSATLVHQVLDLLVSP